MKKCLALLLCLLLLCPAFVSCKKDRELGVNDNTNNGSYVTPTPIFTASTDSPAPNTPDTTATPMPDTGMMVP